MILNNSSHDDANNGNNKNNNIVKDSVQEKPLKILKSYHNRDAAASVTKSFLTIEKDYYANNKNNSRIISEHPVNSLLSSTNNSTTTTTTKINSHNRTSTIVKQKSADEITKKQLKEANQSQLSCSKNNNNINNNNKYNIQNPNNSSVSHTAPPSCISFVNQLVNQTSLLLNENTSSASSSILKEIKKTASYDEIDGFCDENQDYITDKHNQNINNLAFKSRENSSKKQKNYTSSSSSTSTTSSQTSPKDSFVQLGVKLIQKIRSSHNHTESSGQTKQHKLKKSDSSNSSSSVNLSASSSFANYKTTGKDQVDNRTCRSNMQSEFIALHSHQQQQQPVPTFQLLNNKKLRKQLPFNSGLKNHGNTCFMNCVLQCLFHTSPLADFFITDQFQRDMQYITHHEKFNQLQHQQNILGQLPPHHHQQLQQQQHSSLPQFILTKHFYRLLTSMWRNSYDSNYSAELKHLIGYMNPTFAGGHQNDSHELCVWLLDKLSQELTIRIETPISPQLLLNNAKTQMKIQSLSFIEELFQVQFKSTVICSKCNYQSNKYETDMMLSLPLPQQQNTKTKQNVNKQQVNIQSDQQQVNKKQRRSLFANLVLSNQISVRYITNENISSVGDTFDQNDSCKSRFYTNNESIQSSIDINDTVDSAKTYTCPFHVKIGVNIQISSSGTESMPSNMCVNGSNDSNCSSVSSTTSSISSQSSAGSVGSSTSSCCPNSQLPNGCNRSSTVLNPTIGDLRRYVSASYQLRHADLVFIDLNRIQLLLSDCQSIKDNFLSNKYNDFIRTNIIDSMCIVELNCPTVRVQPNMPLINVIGINVYYETISSYNLGNQNQQSDHCEAKPTKKCVCYGLPFVLLINRDCSYSDLCKKLLEAQFKYFKDKIMLKYKDLVEKLFTLSLNDPDTQERVKLNPNDELPLYAECVEKFINKTIRISKVSSSEYIKLNIEWRSFEDISNLFKEIDSCRPEFVHRTVRQMQILDEDEMNLKLSRSSLTDSGISNLNTNSIQNIDGTDQIDSKMGSATLNDCFELFTQREELKDENSWMCPKCKKQTNATKKLCISSVPPILIIHLKRFFYKSKSSNFKLTTPVWFPVCNLDISKYISVSKSGKRCDGNQNENENLDSDENEIDDEIEVVNNENRDLYNQSYVYDLFAVCNHKGQNMANGHYTAFCKNLIDTRWYNFDDASCTPLVESTSSQSSLYNNGSTSVCTENAYILFYKKRNCMRNEKWWLEYVDRSLLDSDEFDRFVGNLDHIEIEQQKYQMYQQSLQLKHKQQQQQQKEKFQTTNTNKNVNQNNIQNVNNVNQGFPNNNTVHFAANTTNTNGKKMNGLNKTLRKFWKPATPINNTDDELNALRKVLYNNEDSNTNTNYSELYASSNNTSIDSELVAINRQAEMQRIQQMRFEEAINNNYYLNKQASLGGNVELPLEVNLYDESVKPNRLVNKINNYNQNSVLAQSSSADSMNEAVNESAVPTPIQSIPLPQQKIAYNNEFKKPFNGFMDEYKPVQQTTPVKNQQANKTYLVPPAPLNHDSLESNERFYLNNYPTVDANNSVRTNEDYNDLTTTEEINNVSSYHNNQNSSNISNVSTVDSLLSYPSDNEYMYSQSLIQSNVTAANSILPQQYTASMVQDYIINNSKAFYMSNNNNNTNNNNRNGSSLTPIQEHQLIMKHPQSPPFYFNNQPQQPTKPKQHLHQQQTLPQPHIPVAQARYSNLKNSKQQNGNRYINSNSIETPI